MRSENNCLLTAVGLGSQTESHLDHLVTCWFIQLGNSTQDNPAALTTHGGAFIRLDVYGPMLMNFNITVGFNDDLPRIELTWISCHESHW